MYKGALRVFFFKETQLYKENIDWGGCESIPPSLGIMYVALDHLSRTVTLS